MRRLLKLRGESRELQVIICIRQVRIEVKTNKKGRVHGIDNQQITVICRILGCPMDKKSGMYLNRKLDETVDLGDILCTLYCSDKWRLKEAVETIKNIPVYKVE